MPIKYTRTFYCNKQWIHCMEWIDTYQNLKETCRKNKTQLLFAYVFVRIPAPRPASADEATTNCVVVVSATCLKSTRPVSASCNQNDETVRTRPAFSRFQDLWNNSLGPGHLCYGIQILNQNTLHQYSKNTKQVSHLTQVMDTHLIFQGLVSAVSIGLFWFYSLSFSNNGVCIFVRFIFNRMLGQHHKQKALLHSIGQKKISEKYSNGDYCISYRQTGKKMKFSDKICRCF